MLDIREIRKMSRAEKEKKVKNHVKNESNKLEKQRLDDLKETRERIKEAEENIIRSAKKGEQSISVCVLRRGIHFAKEFDKSKSPEFLGLIGKTIYDYFSSRRFNVSFHEWTDGMRMGESEDDSGYRVIVSW